MSLSPDEAVKRDPRLSAAFEAMQAAELHANTSISGPAARVAFIEGTRNRIGELLREGKDIPGPIVAPITRKRGIGR